MKGRTAPDSMQELACLAIALVLSASSSVQDTKPEPSAGAEDPFARLERAVPADATMYLAVRDFRGLREDLQKNSWYGFVREPAMRAWVDRALEEIDLSDVDEAPIDPLAFFGSIDGAAAVFIQWEEDAKEPSAGGVLLQPGEERDDFDAQLDGVLELTRKDRSASTESYSGVDLEVLEKDGKLVVLFDLPDMVGLVFGDAREKVLPLAHGVLDRYRGKDAAEGMASSGLLSEARASASIRPRMEFLIALAPLIPSPDAESISEEDRLGMKLFAVDELRWVYLGADAGAGEALDVVFSAAVPSRGILRHLTDALGTLPAEWLKLYPKSAASIGLARFDFASAWREGWKLFGELEPEKHKEARGQLEGMEQMTGLALEKDLIFQLDGRFGSFSMEVPAEEWSSVDGQTYAAAGVDAPSGPKLGTGYLIGVADLDTVEAFVDQVIEIGAAQGIPSDVETVEFQGFTINQLELPQGAPLGWCFFERQLAISMYPSALREVLRLSGKTDQPTSADSPLFKPVLARFAGASALGVNDTRVTLLMARGGLETLLGAVEPLLAASSSEGESKPRPLPPLPSAELIERWFKGTMSSVVTRRGGTVQFALSAR
jgi:hypothetical protein